MRKKMIIAAVCILMIATIGAIMIFKPFADTASKTSGGQSIAAGEEQDATAGEEQNR